MVETKERNRGGGGGAKLDAEKVAEMRLRRAQGEKYAVLGREYGVAESTAWRACKRKLWAHVGEAT